MKQISAVLVAFAILVSGVFTPVFAAPSPEQVQQFVQNQPQDEDPRVVNAQEAFALAAMNYSMDKMSNQLNDHEKKIDQIFEAADLNQSLAASVTTVLPADTFADVTTAEEFNAKIEELLAQDPQIAEKIIQAYLQNKYIKQLIPAFWANQQEYQASETDQNTFNRLVVTFTLMSVSMMQQLQQMQQED